MFTKDATNVHISCHLCAAPPECQKDPVLSVGGMGQASRFSREMSLKTHKDISLNSY